MFDIRTLFESIGAKVRSPIAIVLGSPKEAAFLASLCPQGKITCFQLDLHQSDRLSSELISLGIQADVEVRADLWDIAAHYQTVIMPIARHGERELKLDLLEQAFHILVDKGMIIALSEYRRDQLLPKAIKKIYGRCGEMPASKAGGVFWGMKEGVRPRRKHELTFHARIGTGPSHSFLSKPGVFSYGEMDDGARALLETAIIKEGDAILDLGCGLGTNGVLASDRAGSAAPITFVDSNVRAIALAELNASANGLTNYKTIATATMSGLAPQSFDLILANPPYFAVSAIAMQFIRGSQSLLRPHGRFYLVTKQVEHVAPLIVEQFGEVDVYDRRGYTVIEAQGAGNEQM